MAEHTTIRWTDHTFNPWIGCAKVAPGCEHCYAEAFAKRYGKAQWGPHGTRVKTSETYWRQPLKWDAAAVLAGVRRRVFCASLADVFEDWRGPIVNADGKRLWTPRRGYVWDLPIPETPGYDFSACRPLTMDDLRESLLWLMSQTPHLDWLVLTKRPENARKWLRDKYRSNLWLGTSVSDQATAERNVPLLLQCRDLVPVLFLSCEPLLGPIKLDHVDVDASSSYCQINALTGRHTDMGRPCHDVPHVDWVIAGGESGPQHRPMDPAWARSLRDQCRAAAVPFFFKQSSAVRPGQAAEVDGQIVQEFPR
jgi:protein gp37